MNDLDPMDRIDALVRGPWSDPQHPPARVGHELRRLGAWLLSAEPTPDELVALADALARLGGEPRPASRYGPGPALSPADVPRLRPNGNGTHPLCGPVNPISPPLTVRVEGTHAIGEAVYDTRFEGLPGLVQGGFIAAGFDLMLGQGVVLAGKGGPTGTLSVRYVAPTPLHQALRYETWTERIEGRRIHARGTLSVVASGLVTAEAEGVFVAPRDAS